MGSLGDAIRAMKGEPPVAPKLPGARIVPEPMRLPRPSARPPHERRRVYWLLAEWLYKRWDESDPGFTLDVYDVCSGNLATWETWLDLAPLDKLTRGLALIEAEDAYLGSDSPWRKPRP